MDLARACHLWAVSVPLPPACVLVDVFGIIDDLTATLNGNGNIGGYVAELTIALAIVVVNQMTVTAAAPLRALRPGCS